MPHVSYKSTPASPSRPTGGAAVHHGAAAGLHRALPRHRGQLRLHPAPHPPDQVPAARAQREAHPGHRGDLLHLLAALPHGQPGAGGWGWVGAGGVGVVTGGVLWRGWEGGRPDGRVL